MTGPGRSPDLTPPDLTTPTLPPTEVRSFEPRSGTVTPDPDRDFLVRSEERLQVSTVQVPSGRVRLEKFVVTETRTITVEVSHEEFRFTELPVTADDEAVAAGSDHAHPDDLQRWLVLSEERVVITKETVPLERVRLQIDTVTDHQQITDQVRAERIEVDPTTPPGHRPRLSHPRTEEHK